MNEVAIRQNNFDVALNDIESTQKVCEKLMKTPHYSKLGQDGIYAVVAKAKSLNINPVEALNGGLYYVQGKVGMSAEMMAALIRQAGHSITKDPKSNESIVILHGRRADNGDTWMTSFSLDDAKRAGLLKNIYDKYPGIMLYNRAMSMLARQLFPDIIKGAGYGMDELIEISKSNNHSATIQHISQIQEVQEVELISKEQIQQITDLLFDCSEDYRNKTLEALDKSYGIKSLNQMKKRKKHASLAK